MLMPSLAYRNNPLLYHDYLLILKALMKTTRSLSVNRNHKKDDYSAEKIHLFCSYLDECLTQGWVRTKVKTETCTKYLCQRSSDTFPTYPEAMKLNY